MQAQTRHNSSFLAVLSADWHSECQRCSSCFSSSSLRCSSHYCLSSSSSTGWVVIDYFCALCRDRSWRLTGPTSSVASCTSTPVADRTLCWTDRSLWSFPCSCWTVPPPFLSPHPNPARWPFRVIEAVVHVWLDIPDHSHPGILLPLHLPTILHRSPPPHATDFSLPHCCSLALDCSLSVKVYSYC